jgi:hypothetical protein
MKKQTRILKNGSARASVSQPKTARSRAGDHSDFTLPRLALFAAGGDGAAQEVIDLSKAEYAALKRAAAAAGSGVLMFMANAALGQSGRTGRTVTCKIFLPDGREWASVDFRSDLFALIESCRSKLGITLEKFFDLAIRNRIRSQAVRRAA